MSLRIWLPLNGDLENKGLDDIIVTNNGATINDNGKIGKCYSFNGSNSGINITGNIFSLLQAGDFSISFWLYSNDAGDRSIYLSTIPSSGYALGIEKSTSDKLRVYWQSSPDYYPDFAIPDQTWCNIIIVIKNANCYCYRDGVLIASKTDGSFTPAKLTNTWNYAMLGRDLRTGATVLNGKLNDFRWYDHALSLKEIKEIAKGLILHYPLNSPYIESSTNLITSQDCLSSTCYNGAISKYGYGTNTDMYKEVTIFEDKKGTKVYNLTNGTSMYPYVYINNMYTSNGTNAPLYKTLNFDYYSTISTTITPYKLGNGSGTATYKVINTEIKTGIGTNQVDIPVKPNMWNHVEIIFHGTTEADAQWGYIMNKPSHTSNTSNFWFFANMQLETKDHATGYLGPGKSSLDSIIYDCSGYGNNGITNNLICSFNSDKYNNSVILNGSNSYIKITDNKWMPQYTLELTVSIFGYSDNWASITGGRLWSCAETGGFNILGGASGYWRFPVYVATNALHTSHAYKYNNTGLKISDLSSGWHMFTWVFTTTNHYIYIDGKLYNESVQTNYGLKFNLNARLFLGCEANTASPTTPYFNGQLSNFRIYATALSDDDILELYQTTTFIDRNKNFYTYSYNENIAGNFLNITRQGITNTTEIQEDDIGVSINNVYELTSNNFYEY